MPPVAPVVNQPSAPATNNLTPKLTQTQLQQNIAALQKGGMANSGVQAYVNNYKSDGAGGFVLANAPANPTPLAQPNLASRVVTDTNAHAANITEDLSQKPSFTGALDVAGNVAGEAGDFLGEPLKSLASTALTPELKQGIKSAVSSIAGTPEAKAVIGAWNNLQATHPDAAKNIGNVINIASLMGGDAASPTVEDAAQTVKEGASTAGKVVSDAAKGVADAATTAVKAPITAASDMATPIDKNVLTILKNPTADTENTVKQMFAQAKTAVGETGAPTPFDTVGKTRLGNALATLKDKLSTAGKTMNDVLASSGGKTVDISPVAQEFESSLPSRLGTAVNGEGDFVDAPGRVSLIAKSASDSRVVGSVKDALTKLGDSPTLQQVNDTVDNLQGELYKAAQVGAEPINGNTQSFVKGIVGKLNQAAKDVGGDEYTSANSDYSRLKGMQTDLNKRLGPNMKNAGSIVKRIFSPQDGGTKDLVKALEQETGEPIFHDATLAKFAMDAVGDPRAQSLLQQGLTAKSKGILKAAFDYATSKLEDPEGKALRIITNAQSK